MRTGHRVQRASSRGISISIIGSVATLLYPAVLHAQDGRIAGPSPALIAPAAVGEIDPLVLTSNQLVCGDLSQAGTPIAGNALGADGVLGGGDDGNSGKITIAGIPATATVHKATLYWTVLTNNAESSSTGASITFNGTGVLGVKMGTNSTSPCFTQDNTIAWKADVTALVGSPGNGVYTVAGFPGGNQISTGANTWTEGATLQVMWTTDDDTPLRWINSYEAPAGAGNLFVSPGSGNTIGQVLGGFTASGAPTSGKLFEVIGNGQGNGTEDLSVSGGAGVVTFDDTLDGSTVAKAANTCSYTDSPITECYWDDDVQDISGAIAAANTQVTFRYTMGSDCHDFPALAVSVKSDVSFAAYCAEGGAFVDAECPEAGPLGGGEWANHGDYVSCVAHAANTYLLENSTVCSTSCIVNPRARSNVGRGGGNPH